MEPCLRGEDIHRLPDAQFLEEGTEEEIPHVLFQGGVEGTRAGFLGDGSGTLLVHPFHVFFIVGNRVGHAIRHQLIDIAEGLHAPRAGCLLFLVPVRVVHLQIDAFFLLVLP